MKMLTVLFAMLLSVAANAQPTKDLFDAQQAARQHERDLVPSLQLARETAGVLRLFEQVETTLGNTQLPAGSALDRALIQIDEYNRELEKRRALLPSDIRRRIGRGREILDHARTPMPSDLTLLRDQWHHEIIHPTAKRVAEDAQALAGLISLYSSIENGLRQLQATQLGVLANSENVAGLPQGVRP